MLSVINFRDYPEKLEILVDKQGIEELIKILNNVINTQEHYHLIEGVEIDEYIMKGDEIGNAVSVKAITIEYLSVKATELKN